MADEHMQKAIAITKALGHDGPVEPWTRILAECLARDAASHAPKPEDQPIRRGDVVQVTQYASEYFLECGIVTEVDRWPSLDQGCQLVTFQYLVLRDGRRSIETAYTPALNLIRIGRARYYPDGTPVDS